MNRTILIVEDEKRMNEIIGDYFETEGYEVLSAYDGVEALNIVANNDIDMIILDIMMPKLDGFSVCTRIRKSSDALIIILSARAEEDDKLMGFSLGADEYVTKPFSPKVLVARAEALFSRVRKFEVRKPDVLIRKGNIVIDKDGYSVTLDNINIKLTNKEFELLLLLVENEGRVYTREMLINTVWGYDFLGNGRIVDTNIKTLRKKLNRSAEFIKTVIGVGYKFEVSS